MRAALGVTPLRAPSAGAIPSSLFISPPPSNSTSCSATPTTRSMSFTTVRFATPTSSPVAAS
eukprot:12764998-Alexandrium_andersonii.AAC.1